MILTPNTPCSWFDAGRAFDDDVVIFTSLSDWECREYELCVDESPREIWKNGFAHCGSSTSHRLGIGVLFHAAEPSGTLNVRLPAPDRCLISVGQTAHNIHTKLSNYYLRECAVRNPTLQSANTTEQCWNKYSSCPCNMFMKCEFVCVYIHGLPRNMAIGRANFLTIYGLEITKSRRRKWDGKSSIVIGVSGVSSVCFGFLCKKVSASSNIRKELC